MISVKVIGDKVVAARLALAGAKADVEVSRKVTYWGTVLESKIKARAPVRTGDYRRSWTTTVGRQGGGAAAVVGTNKPQARRLEYGFVGADSLGRHYNQAPRPHVRPAMAEVEGPFVKDIESVAPR